MTRIGNDTKTAKSQSTTSTTSSEGSTQAKQAEQAPTLDELDAGKSLARDYANPELPDVGPQSGMSRAVDDVGQSTFEGMTPLAQTPALPEVAALEQQCALEVQGHAYDLRSLASDVGGDDGVCLEKASDAMMTSVEEAGQAAPGSALPALADGVTAAGEHVKRVSDEKTRQAGEGMVSRAWSFVSDAVDKAVDKVRAARDVDAGESVELGFAASVSGGVIGAETKETLSLSRQQNPDGSGGGYVVAHEKAVAGSLGADAKVSAEFEAGTAKLSATAEASATEKLEGSIRVEHRYQTKEQADAHVDEALLDKGKNLAAALTGGPAAALGSVVQELAGLDLTGASSVTATGSAGLDLAAKLGLEGTVAKGVGGEGSLTLQGSAKEAVSLKVDLDKGTPKRAELTTTRQLEATAQGSLLASLGGASGGFKDVKGGSASLSIADKRLVSFDKDGKPKSAGREISVTLDLMVEGKKVKGEITVPPGADADAIGAMLDDGNVAGAMARLKDAGASLKLEGAIRDEVPLGFGLKAGVGLDGRAHYAREKTALLDEKSGTVGDLLQQAWSDGTRRLSPSDNLERQVEQHQMYR